MAPLVGAPPAVGRGLVKAAGLAPADTGTTWVGAWGMGLGGSCFPPAVVGKPGAPPPGFCPTAGATGGLGATGLGAGAVFDVKE